MTTRTVEGVVEPYQYLTFRSALHRFITRSDRTGEFSIVLVADQRYDYESLDDHFSFELPVGTNPIELETLKGLGIPQLPSPDLTSILAEVEELIDDRLSGVDTGQIYQRTFTDSDLSVAGLLPVLHGLSGEITSIRVVNNEGEELLPDSIKPETSITMAIGLMSFRPLVGTWKVVIS